MALNKDIYGTVPEQDGVKTDFVVPVCMFILFLMGVAFIYSTQSYNIDEIPLSRQFWVKQIFFFCCVGFPIYVALAWFDYKWLFTYADVIYMLSLALLVPLALKENLGLPIPFVESRFNATRWIDLGPISIQPSEIAKIGTCIMASAMVRPQCGQKKSQILAKNRNGFFNTYFVDFFATRLRLYTRIFSNAFCHALYIESPQAVFRRGDIFVLRVCRRGCRGYIRL